LDEFEFFLEKDWSDGFPVVTPTKDRVSGMLSATRRDPDEVIGPIPPAGEIATVRSVAVHAVMAGCKPEYFPVVLGGLAQILREELNIGGVQQVMLEVRVAEINRAVAQQIGINFNAVGAHGSFGVNQLSGLASIKNLARTINPSIGPQQGSSGAPGTIFDQLLSSNVQAMAGWRAGGVLWNVFLNLLKDRQVKLHQDF